ncbi:MAG: ribokinase [Burkholderiales bacterium]
MSRVIVVGSINVDLVARVDRFPRPGETLFGHDLRKFPGGKGANQAVAAARLGAQSAIVGAVGDDAFGVEMLAFLGSMGVDKQGVLVRPGEATGTALISVCGGENTIVVVPGANATVDARSIDALDLYAGDVVLCQLEVPIPAVAAVLDRARQCGAISILNAAPALAEAASILADCDVLVLNEIELAAYARIPIHGDAALETVADAAGHLRARDGQVIIVTLGHRGSVVSRSDRWFHERGREVVVVDTTGAGDCFCGALAAALARGMTIEAAVKFANVAASIAVQRVGAGPSMPLLAEVEALLNAP